MDKIMEELHSIKVIAMVTLFIVFMYAGFGITDRFKGYVIETSSFSKYIDIKELYIYNTRMEGGKFLNDGITRRIVKINDSYELTVIKEIECGGTGNWSQIGTAKEVWLVDREGNPEVTSLNKVNPFNVKSGDTCFFRYDMSLEHKGYTKKTTMNSNVFTIE